jgi:hypothetical protein
VTRVAAAAICKLAVALDASATTSAKMANPDDPRARGVSGKLNAKGGMRGKRTSLEIPRAHIVETRGSFEYEPILAQFDNIFAVNNFH